MVVRLVLVIWVRCAHVYQHYVGRLQVAVDDVLNVAKMNGCNRIANQNNAVKRTP